jgi:TolA-binding protein
MDPERLINESTDGFERELLRAGRADSMSADSRRAILGALGVGGSLLAAGTIAAGVKAGSGKSLLAALGLGSVSALGIWAGVHFTSLDESPAPPVAPRAAPQAPLVTAKPAPEAPAQPTVDAPPTAETPKATQPSRAPADPLSLELSAIESARAALGRRDYSRALRLLDDHAKRFPKAHLMAEATVLRIEALVARGDKAGAARIGKAFLLRDPNGPYARRVRSLLGDAAPAPGGP